jgi:hypothetical protein
VLRAGALAVAFRSPPRPRARLHMPERDRRRPRRDGFAQPGMRGGARPEVLCVLPLSLMVRPSSLLMTTWYYEPIKI